MQAGPRLRLPPVRLILQVWPLALLVVAGVAIRLSKGAGVADAYAVLSRPFWPGPAQGEWVRQAQRLEDQTRLRQLSADNQRLRQLHNKPLQCLLLQLQIRWRLLQHKW